MGATVDRRDISVEEEREYGWAGDTGTVSWIAKLYGRLSTGENVEMTRSASTFPEALGALETAIAELGWEIK